MHPLVFRQNKATQYETYDLKAGKESETTSGPLSGAPQEPSYTTLTQMQSLSCMQALWLLTESL